MHSFAMGANGSRLVEPCRADVSLVKGTNGSIVWHVVPSQVEVSMAMGTNGSSWG